MLQFNRRAQVIVTDYVFGKKTVTSTVKNKDGSTTVNESQSVSSQDIVIEGLRIKFSVDKTLNSKAYNKTVLEIYNLSEETRKALEGDKKKVILKVGYGTDLKQIAQGEQFLFKHEFVAPDVVTRIEFADGISEGSAKVSYSGKQNMKPLDIIKLVGQQTGVTINAEAVNANEAANDLMAAGFSFIGTTSGLFDSLSEPLNLDWYIEDGVITFVPHGGKFLDIGYTIDESTGMIGTPVKLDDITTLSGNQKKKAKKVNAAPTNPGYDIKCLLNPHIHLGSVIKLESKRLDLKASCKVERILHDGDTHGPEWNSTLRSRIVS